MTIVSAEGRREGSNCPTVFGAKVTYDYLVTWLRLLGELIGCFETVISFLTLVDISGTRFSDNETVEMKYS